MRLFTPANQVRIRICSSCWHGFPCNFLPLRKAVCPSVRKRLTRNSVLDDPLSYTFGELKCDASLVRRRMAERSFPPTVRKILITDNPDRFRFGFGAIFVFLTLISLFQVCPSTPLSVLHPSEAKRETDVGGETQSECTQRSNDI